MPKTRCVCGAKYRFPETSIGKRARCKKCGAIFRLEPQDEEGPIPIADDSELREEMAAAAREAAFGTEPKQGEVFIPSSSPAAAASMGLGSAPAFATGSALSRGFGGDVLWTFLFLSSPSNLITFFYFWIAMALAPMVTCLPLIGIFFWLAVLGWYCAYLFEVLGSAAAGERDLPQVPSPRHLVDVFDPLFKWIGSWVFVFIPAIAYVILTWKQSGITGYDLLPMMANGLASLLGGQGTGTVSFDILVYIGIIFWPMVVLCVALGGFASLYRLDLILWTIIKTLPLYLLTLVLMLGGVFLQQGFMTLAGGNLASQARSGQGSASSMMGLAFALGILGTGIEVYMDIVLMRLIGLYYYHFKDRFAFSWG